MKESGCNSGLRINLLCKRSTTRTSWQKFRSLWRPVSNRAASWRCPGRPEDLERPDSGPSGRWFPAARCQSPTWGPWSSSRKDPATCAGCDGPRGRWAPSARWDADRRRQGGRAAAPGRSSAFQSHPATRQPIRPDCGANNTAISCPKNPWAVAGALIKRCLLKIPLIRSLSVDDGNVNEFNFFYAIKTGNWSDEIWVNCCWSERLFFFFFVVVFPIVIGFLLVNERLAVVTQPHRPSLAHHRIKTSSPTSGRETQTLLPLGIQREKVAN